MFLKFYIAVFTFEVAVAAFTAALSNVSKLVNFLLQQSVETCRKGGPFQGLRVGSCLTLGNELS